MVQSVIIDKNKFSLNKAIKWIKKHNYNIDYGIDEKLNYYRFRQYPPKKGASYITKDLGNGVKLIIETNFNRHHYNYV